jgi:L-threonylcarbamoyladenylate synthase
LKTQTVLWEAASSLVRALECLEAGGLVAFPTDTVYGLGARLDRPAAVERLYTAKARERTKAIPVLLGSIENILKVAEHLPAPAAVLAEAFWPGPLTLVVPRRPGLPEALGPEPTVGVRMPDHPTALALLQAAGPMAVTSANRSGGQSCRTAAEVARALGGRIDLILDGGTSPGTQASTVADCTGGAIRILRPGPISLDDLTRALETSSH